MEEVDGVSGVTKLVGDDWVRGSARFMMATYHRQGTGIYRHHPDDASCEDEVVYSGGHWTCEGCGLSTRGKV